MFLRREILFTRTEYIQPYNTVHYIKILELIMFYFLFFKWTLTKLRDYIEFVKLFRVAISVHSIHRTRNRCFFPDEIYKIPKEASCQEIPKSWHEFDNLKLEIIFSWFYFQVSAGFPSRSHQISRQILSGIELLTIISTNFFKRSSKDFQIA